MDSVANLLLARSAAPAFRSVGTAVHNDVWGFLRPFVDDYDAAIFTMREFVAADLRLSRLAMIPPAIDPLSSKNMKLPREVSRRIVADSGDRL